MTPTGEDMENRFKTLEFELGAIKAQLNTIEQYLVKADKTIASIAEQVMPTINELTNSPMLKMLMGKKK